MEQRLETKFSIINIYVKKELGTKGLFGWEDGKVGGQKMQRGQKRFQFPSFVFGWEGGKWMNRKFFYFVENKICINCPSCPYEIK